MPSVRMKGLGMLSNLQFRHLSHLICCQALKKALQLKHILAYQSVKYFFEQWEQPFQSYLLLLESNKYQRRNALLRLPM